MSGQNTNVPKCTCVSRISKKILPALFLTLIISFAASAQSTAQINGTIKDSTGAVLPGVEVTVNQTDTGLRRSAVTDETGSYILPNLPIGPYRLEAVLPASEATFKPESSCRSTAIPSSMQCWPLAN